MINETGLAHVRWRKSSHSGGGNNCVEVARIGDLYAIRDSKDPLGPHLVFQPSAWTDFVGSLENDQSGGPR